MGAGKGALKAGSSLNLVEFYSSSWCIEEVAREALRLASHKLPVKLSL